MLSTTLLLLFLATSQAEEAAAEPAPKQPLPVVTDDFHEHEPELVRLGYDPAFLKLFDEFSYTYTGGGYEEKLFRYRLFIPEGSSPADKRPLIVWLHGMSTSGDDNYTQLRHLSTLVFTTPWQHDRYPFFLLAIQTPHDNRAWTAKRGLAHFEVPGEQNVPVPLTSDGGAADDMLNVLSAILDKTLAEHPIDPDRVSLTGVSSGGGGAWEFALCRPETFSCVAPLASGGADHSRVSRLANVPVWAFHSLHDPGSPIEGVRQTVAALKAAGGNAHLTEVDSRSHGCWNQAFLDYDLLPWLLEQKRGQRPSQPIGQVSASMQARVFWRGFTQGWTLKQVAAQVAIPAILIIAIWSARRQKRLRRLSREPSGSSQLASPS